MHFHAAAGVAPAVRSARRHTLVTMRAFVRVERARNWVHERDAKTRVSSDALGGGCRSLGVLDPLSEVVEGYGVFEALWSMVKGYGGVTPLLNMCPWVEGCRSSPMEHGHGWKAGARVGVEHTL